MTSPFQLDGSQLTQLSPQDAVQLFRRLLRAEATRLGIPQDRVQVPSRINVADGGIDAAVESLEATLQRGMFACKDTRFQIKTGTTFHPWRDADIDRELFGAGRPVLKENLGSAVRACLEKNGRYVLVCFGLDLVQSQLDDARELLRSRFKACGFSGFEVDVWGQCALVNYLERFPALIRGLNPVGFGPFLDHEEWSRQLEMTRPFQEGPPQRQFIELMRSALRSSDRNHIRICGEAGLGKTRLALEATGVDDLAPLVLYGEGGAFRGSSIAQALISDQSTTAILVIDECEEDCREWLVNNFASESHRVRVVSIYQESDRSAHLNLMEVPRLRDPEIASIISSYGTPDHAQHWAHFCDGSPRVAHVIGQNLIDHPDDVLKEPSSSRVWHRYVAGPTPRDGTWAEETRRVLLCASLFQRFGYSTPVDNEAKTIASLARIEWSRFQEIVRGLRERKVLQGSRTLYITPKAFHVWLWSEWWNTYGEGFDVEEFLPQLTGNLQDWFTEMWRYAHRSRAAQRVVKRLLASDGPFADGKLLATELGSRFFLALTEASPEAAIECLNRTVGAWSIERLRAFTLGRRHVIYALERIAIWKALFVPAARILFRLAEAENEQWANNATGIFAGLFWPGMGMLAPTEASLEERFPVLEEAIRSPDSEGRQVAIRAAKAALQVNSISRMMGPEYQGLRAPPRLWQPETWGELYDGYRRVWALLDARLTQATASERGEIIDILLDRSRSFLGNPHLASVCMATLTRLVNLGWIPSKRVVNVLEDTLHYDSEDLDAELLPIVTQLRDRLIGTGFTARLRRFVGMDRFADQFDADGERSERLEMITGQLADEAMEDPERIRDALPWLVTRDAENAYPFGCLISQRDKGFILLDSIFDAMKTTGEDVSPMFVGGYLQVVFERDTARWDTFLEKWSQEDALVRLTPEVTWRSGMNDRAALRILNLIRSRKADASTLGLFRFGRSIEKLSDPVVIEMARCLLDEEANGAACLAVELLYRFFDRAEVKPNLPLDVLKRCLTDPRLFSKEANHPQSFTPHAWVKLTQRVLEVDPAFGMVLFPLLLDHADDRVGLGNREHGLASVYRKILETNPTESWKILEARLNSEDHSRELATLNWISGDSIARAHAGYWELIPLDRLWNWVNEDVEHRAGLLSMFIPNWLSHDGPGSVTREFIRRYGDRENMKKAIAGRFMSGVWWGDGSTHYLSLKRSAEALHDKEPEETIKRWLEYYIARLENQIDSFRIYEERE